jgi:carboxylesterase
MSKFTYPLFGILVLGFTSCGEPDITEDMLDGNIIFDASLYRPEDFLVSAKYPNPTAEDLDKHILIAVHGYSASTFEWQEFVDWPGNGKNYRVSQVLLGGHGRTYEDFKNSSWQDWQWEIQQEYEKLEALGYTKISLAGSSTGPTLILEMLSSGYFNSHIPPQNVFLIDPIVVSSIKIQSIAGIIGPMLGYIETESTPEENKYWYHFRPHETVDELNFVMKKVRKNLENGFSLPSPTFLKVFHSKNDPTASSTSSVLIYKGVKRWNGDPISVEIMDSEIHVFTRLALRENVSSLQKSNQEKAFTEMMNRLN